MYKNFNITESEKEQILNRLKENGYGRSKTSKGKDGKEILKETYNSLINEQSTGGASFTKDGVTYTRDSGDLNDTSKGQSAIRGGINGKRIGNDVKTNTKVEQGKPLQITLPPSTFASGAYTLTDTSGIDGAIKQITDYIQQYPENTSFNVEVESSESKVPPPKGMTVGQLSKNRADSVVTYLSGKLPKNVAPKVKDMGPQGPEWVGNEAKGRNWIEFTKYQYVRLTISAQGQKTVKTETKNLICNFEEHGVYPVNIDADFLAYDKDIDISDVPDGKKIKLWIGGYITPQMMIVTAGDYSHNTGIMSAEGGVLDLSVATILGNHYLEKGSEIPKIFPQNIVKIGPDTIRQMHDNNSASLTWANGNLAGIIPNWSYESFFPKGVSSVLTNKKKLADKYFNETPIYNFNPPDIGLNRSDVADPDYKKYKDEAWDTRRQALFVKKPGVNSVNIKVYGLTGSGNVNFIIHGICLD
jgi:hypothetical protein